MGAVQNIGVLVMGGGQDLQVHFIIAALQIGLNDRNSKSIFTGKTEFLRRVTIIVGRFGQFMPPEVDLNAIGERRVSKIVFPKLLLLNSYPENNEPSRSSSHT